MNSFSVIAGSGHCGTKWLASVLDSQRGIIWYHDFREEMTGLPWEVVDFWLPSDKRLAQYWRWIKGELTQSDVGDAASWSTHLLPAVNEHMPIQRVIYMTRNGIQQLHSIATTSPAMKSDPRPKVAEVKLRTLYDIWGKGEKPYEDMSHFETLCLMVAANDFMPDWLRRNGLVVDVCSLDMLLKDVSVLGALAPGLDEETLRRWQKTDINRKTAGGRAESTIWNNWPPEWRKTYRAVIG